MRENGLLSLMYNHQTRKYDSSIGPQGKKAMNRLNRRFNTDRPYQKMVTDVSEYRYGDMSQNERVYLSPIKDLCTGEIVSIPSSRVRQSSKFPLGQSPYLPI